MAGPAGGASKTPSPWVPARDRTDPKSALRILVGLFAVFVAVLAVLALLNSFFVEQPPPGDPTTRPPGPDPDPDQGGGGSGGERTITCQDVVDFLMWTTAALGGGTLILLGVAVARREANQGKVLTNVWGILSIILLFFTLVAAGVWRLMDWMCNGAPTCKDLIDGSYVTFLVLMAITVGSVAFGIAYARMRDTTYVKTRIGIIGIVLYLPALITGVFWWTIRLLCNPDLWSCAYFDDTLNTLEAFIWVGLLGGLAALGVGIYLQVKEKKNPFATGWAILAIMLLLLGVLSGVGFQIVQEFRDAVSLVDPDCPIVIPDVEEIEEPPTCRELADRIAKIFWLLMGLVGALTVGGLIAHRKEPRRFFGSIFAIFAYILLGLALLTGLLFLVISSACEGEGEDPGQGGDDSGTGDGTQGGGTGDDGPDGGSPGGGGPDGGGGGGTGSGPPRPTIQINPLPLTWVLVAVAAIAAVALLIMLLRRRAAVGPFPTGDAGLLPPEEVSARERAQLMQLLGKRDLASAEAVIAAYRVFLSWSTGVGLPKESYETPREHAGRVLAEYDVPADAMRGFISAYEVARLGNRNPTAAERKLAVEFSKELEQHTAPEAEFEAAGPEEEP